MVYSQLINIMGYSELPPEFFGLFLLLLVWSFVWKGIALWKSARVGSKPWFVIFLLVNTVGILEIIYIFLIGKKKQQSQAIEQ